MLGVTRKITALRSQQDTMTESEPNCVEVDEAIRSMNNHKAPGEGLLNYSSKLQYSNYRGKSLLFLNVTFKVLRKVLYGRLETYAELVVYYRRGFRR